ncbi:hypothetical protein NMY22_g2045 [Coprinellus aureogranulatus]|nr:hypothetical protein NMY22_g2045 [Coprinellus aureogranulatus]
MQADLSGLLESNDVPTHEEVMLAKRVIVDLVAQLSNLGAQLRKHEAILSPVRRLPAEILGRIFYFASAGESGYTDEEDRDALLMFCLVCKTWNEAAQVKSELWGQLRIDSFDYDAHKEDVERWLARANQASRVVGISSYGCDCSMYHDSWSEAGQDEVDDEEDAPCYFQSDGLAKFLASGPVLNTLHLEMQSTLCFARLMHGITIHSGATKPSWDSIRSLRLSWDSDGAWIEAQSLERSLFRHLPSNLKSLHLDLPAPEYVTRHRSSPFPWKLLRIPPTILQGLTSLTISSHWDGPHVLECLQHCKNLETLRFEQSGLPVEYEWWEKDSGGFPLVDDLRRGVFLPKLHSLDLICVDASTTGKYLPYLRVPALVNLTVQFREFHYYEKVRDGALRGVSDLLSSLEGLTPNMKERIRSLSIGRDGEVEEIDAKDLIIILSGLTSLESLTLNYVTFDPRVLQAPPTSLFISSVQHLEILNVPAEFNFEAMLQFLQRHTAQSSGSANTILKRVRFSYAKAIKPFGDQSCSADWSRCYKAQQLREKSGVMVEGDISLENRWLLYHMPSRGRIAPYYVEDPYTTRRTELPNPE